MLSPYHQTIFLGIDYLQFLSYNTYRRHVLQVVQLLETSRALLILTFNYELIWFWVNTLEIKRGIQAILLETQPLHLLTSLRQSISSSLRLSRGRPQWC